jgi:hypothetical protein
MLYRFRSYGDSHIGLFCKDRAESGVRGIRVETVVKRMVSDWRTQIIVRILSNDKFVLKSIIKTKLIFLRPLVKS